MYVDKYIKANRLDLLNRELIRDSQYLAFDIEAYIDNDEYIPYSCAFYKGFKNDKYIYREYNLIHFNHWEDMLNKALIDIFNLFPNHTVYVHNLGGFDSLYFIKPLFKIGNVKTLFKDNKLISI